MYISEKLFSLLSRIYDTLGMYNKILRICNSQKKDLFCGKQVSFFVSHKHTSLDKHTNLLKNLNIMNL
jgi:hypothetical protein